VAHVPPEHPAQSLPFPPVTTRPSLWAAKTEIIRTVCSLWQAVQAMGASASAMDRRASNLFPQSVQWYS
jgi:hypothetical protein